jgi:hypothetical protein
VSDAVSVLAEGLADRLWQRILVQDRVEALDEHAEGPTCARRLARDRRALAEAVEEALSAVLTAVAGRDGREALRGLRDGGGGELTPCVDALLRAGLAVTTWSGDGVSVSEAGRAVGDLCDAVTARVTELVGARLRAGDGG